MAIKSGSGEQILEKLLQDVRHWYANSGTEWEAACEDGEILRRPALRIG
jgi:hypothetical protein